MMTIARILLVVGLLTSSGFAGDFTILETNNDLIRLCESDKNVIVINVLTKEYADDCKINIGKSIHVAYKDLDQWASKNNKHSPVVVYCGSPQCSLSMSAAEKLSDLGFVHVYKFKPGTKGWKQAGFSTLGACKLDYLR